MVEASAIASFAALCPTTLDRIVPPSSSDSSVVSDSEASLRKEPEMFLARLRRYIIARFWYPGMLRRYIIARFWYPGMLRQDIIAIFLSASNDVR